MDKEKEIIIRPQRSLQFPNCSEMWEHRDILRYLVKKEYLSKYKQTILGPLWFMLQPLLFALVLKYTMGTIVDIDKSTSSPFLFYLASMVGWNYFSTTFQSISTCLTSQAELFKKVYFPRLLVPLSTTLSSLISAGFQLAVFFIFYLVLIIGASLPHTIGLCVFFIPIFIFQIGLISLGTGLILSSMTAKYRDFHNVMTLLVQLLFFVTPIIYPLSQTTGLTRNILLINPLTAPIEGLRSSLLGTSFAEPSYFFISFLVSMMISVIGIFLFQKTQKDFIDYV